MRVFAGPWTYPAWWPRGYEGNVPSWSTNTIGAPASVDFSPLILQSISPTPGSFLYYSERTITGHVVRYGFEGRLTADRIGVQIYGYAAVDGVMQLSQSQHVATFLNPTGWPYGPGDFSPAAGAVLVPDPAGVSWVPW